MNKSLILIILASFFAFGQDEMKPWERLGLSKTEWMMIEDNKMPMSQVEFLLKSGIGISEYFKKPWVDLGLTEQKWIEKKRSGMSNYDIEIEAKSTNSEWKTEMKNGFNSEMNGMSENRENFLALLPGIQQFRAGSHTKGVIMASLAAGAITWCAAGSINNKRFEALPIFVILVPDIVWSYADYKISRKKKSK